VDRKDNTHKVIFWATFFLVWTVGLACAQTSITEATDSMILQQGLDIDDIGQYGRSPVHQDALAEQIVLGTWTIPKASDTITSEKGETKSWQPIKADSNGWFSDRRRRGGYIYVSVHSEAERIMILHMMGNSMAYVNGKPRVGSRYQSRDTSKPWAPNFAYVRVPVLLKKGHNDLLFKRTRRAGGRVKATLIKPKAAVLLNSYDCTLPDLRVGESIETQGAVVLINATQKVRQDLQLTVSGSGLRKTAVNVPIIQPLSVRKVAFPIKYKGSALKEPGKQRFDLKVVQKAGRRLTVLDQQEIPLEIKAVTDSYKRTYVSRVDGSVQYYAVNPATPLPGDKTPPALVLSVHGASVEAINQARAYGSKTWCNIVCPTNRRAYGFDWEDWGRIDALDVLNDAKAKFEYDPSQVYLTGHSMGGHGAWILGSTYPDQFAAVEPCAGWLSFNSYVGGKTITDLSPMEQMLKRAESAGDAAQLAKNLTGKGVYILHGGADNTVPKTEPAKMMEILKTFHTDYVYHEEPGKGHWYDLSKEPGADCVDWAPMFDYFARHALPSDRAVRQVEFVTVNPGISAWRHWAGIEDQMEPLKASTISIRLDPGLRQFVGTTKNVARLSFKLDTLSDSKPVTVALDGQSIKDIPFPAEKQIWLTQTHGTWAIAKKANPAMKGPHRYGPFKEAFNHDMVFVFGTQGNAKENAWAQATARFASEQWWYQGNGAVDIISDDQFTAAKYTDRGVILFGNAETNAAWNILLKHSPVQVTSKAVTIGDKQIQGKDLACLFLQPRKDSEFACVAAVSGTGISGMRLTSRLQYIWAGSNYPDCLVIGPDMLKQGVEGVRVAGVFGSDWSVDSGTFVWANRKTASNEPTELPAYIGPDPRPFLMPRHYICQRASGPMTVDGRLDEGSWKKAAWTEPHLDIEGQMRPVTPKHRTRTKMLWDDDYFYVASQLDDPHVWGTIAERNAVIFNDNDFEVFIDPDGDSHSYYEFEMNALNTVWNLLMNKPYKNGGNAVIREMPGQKSGVYVKGTLNNPGDTDAYWTVEIAFPWKGMAEHADCPCPPLDGNQWRVGFSRVQWGHKVVDNTYVRYPNKEERTEAWHEDNWIWSPQGVVNMHRPETWGYVQFSAQPVGSNVQFIPDPTAEVRYLLHKVLYAQEQYKSEHKAYAQTLKALNLGELTCPSLAGPITVQTQNDRWKAEGPVKLPNGKTKTLAIRWDGKIQAPAPR